MKRQKTKLQFDKKSIVELTDSQELAVNGGCQYSNSSNVTLYSATATIVTLNPVTSLSIVSVSPSVNIPIPTIYI